MKLVSDRPLCLQGVMRHAGAPFEIQDAIGQELLKRPGIRRADPPQVLHETKPAIRETKPLPLETKTDAPEIKEAQPETGETFSSGDLPMSDAQPAPLAAAGDSSVSAADLPGQPDGTADRGGRRGRSRSRS